jgi:dTDP-4-amino-4,6-dideoxygalactose transaminase
MANRDAQRAMKHAPLRFKPVSNCSPAFEKRLPIVSPEGLPHDEFLSDVRRILSSRQLTNATFVREFEEVAAEYLGVPHCVAVASCTAGLILTLRALELQGEVILPSFTFHATAHSVLWNGLKPVFADCDSETFCIDPRAVKSQLSEKTVALLAVHLFGNPASVVDLQTIASDLGVPLIYDAAHAFGSEVNERRVGTFGTAEVFSFSPTKLLVAGEGGMIATRDADLARKLRAARNYGDSGNYDPDLAGLNARMSEFHAALALRGLRGLDARIARRNEIRLQYQQRLGSIPGISFQRIAHGSRSSCKDFAILVDETAFGKSRDWLVDSMEKENIQVRRYFWPPVHRQKLYCDIWEKQPLPVTDRVSSSILNLPIYSTLSTKQIDKVCDAILRSYKFASKSGLARAQRA